MCCTGRASGDLEPARYPEQTHMTRAPDITTKKTKKQGQLQKASTPAVHVQTGTAEALLTTAGDLQQDLMFQFNLSADNTQLANMANDATLLDINMGLNVPVSTQSGLFLPDDMHLDGLMEDGIGLGGFQLDDDLLPSWDPGFNFGAHRTQTSIPSPMMPNPSGAPSNLGGLLEGAFYNTGTAGPIGWDGHVYSAGPPHTDDFASHSNNSLGQFPGPDSNNLQSQRVVPGQDIGNILRAPSPASVTNEPGVPAMSGRKRKAGQSEHDKLPRKKGRPAANQNIAIHPNPESAGHKAPIISRSSRERRVSERVAAAATKAAKEAAKEVKATKAQGKTKTSRSGRK